MVISANSIATSVIGFCRPVSTLASLIGVASGSVTEESLTDRIRSRVAAPAVNACAGTPEAAGIGAGIEVDTGAERARLVVMSKLLCFGAWDARCDEMNEETNYFDLNWVVVPTSLGPDLNPTSW